jgi:flagellar hook-length control protein FliK
MRVEANPIPIESRADRARPAAPAQDSPFSSRLRDETRRSQNADVEPPDADVAGRSESTPKRPEPTPTDADKVSPGDGEPAAGDEFKADQPATVAVELFAQQPVTAMPISPDAADVEGDTAVGQVRANAGLSAVATATASDDVDATMTLTNATPVQGQLAASAGDGQLSATKLMVDSAQTLSGGQRLDGTVTSNLPLSAGGATQAQTAATTTATSGGAGGPGGVGGAGGVESATQAVAAMRPMGEAREPAKQGPTRPVEAMSSLSAQPTTSVGTIDPGITDAARPAAPTAGVTTKAPGLPEVVRTAAPGENVQAVANAVRQSAESGGNRQVVTVRLDPPQLGNVRVHVRAVEGVMTASIGTSSELAHAVVRASADQLQAALERSGVTVDRIQVTRMGPAGSIEPTADTGRGTAGDQQQSQGREDAQQQQRDQARREAILRLWQRDSARQAA